MAGFQEITPRLVQKVHAQVGGGGAPQQIPLPNFFGTSCNDLLCVLGKILDVLTKIAIPIVAIMVVIGAIEIMTAGGNQERVTQGRKTIQYAVIGFAALLLASSVVPVLTSLFQ